MTQTRKNNHQQQRKQYEPCDLHVLTRKLLQFNPWSSLKALPISASSKQLLVP